MPSFAPAAPRHAAFTLAAILVGAGMLGLAFAYGIEAMRKTDTPKPRLDDTAEEIILRLDGKPLAIPQTWLAGKHRPDEAAEEVRLHLVIDGEGAPRPIEVLLLPLGRVQTSASLLDAVYVHAFDEEALTGPSGLTGKRLLGESYHGETVWFDALSLSPFVARCAAPLGEGRPATCLRTVALEGGMAAVYAFGADTLAKWRQLDAEIEPWLKRIGAL